VDVRALVRRTVSICRATFDRGVELPVFEDPDVPSVLGEGGQIEQIFLNVFLNARDAFDSAHSSERVIRTHIDVVERARAGTAPLPCVRVRISDTGPGMSDAVRSRVFEPFFTTKDVGRGSGLGLATAYAIATDHGGMLSCESVVGEGTTFTLTIPAVLELEQEPTISPRGYRGGRETILVVDDERMVRKTVRSVLEPEGYRVLEATDGIEAFETFQRERGSVDLVLLDLSMPGIPGDAVLKSILRERPNARVVLFTGREPETLPIGATAMLQKPVKIDELLRVVRSVCDESGTGLT
jgi:CheY-like chemotaxis protein